MKKPVYIYLIAFWVFIQYGFFRSIPLALLQSVFTPQPWMFQAVNVTVALSVVVLVVGLVQLRNLPRLISSLLLITSSFGLCWIFAGMLLSGAPFGIRAYASFPVMLLVNMSCIYYLFSKKFINQAQEYRKQVREGGNKKSPAG